MRHHFTQCSVAAVLMAAAFLSVPATAVGQPPLQIVEAPRTASVLPAPATSAIQSEELLLPESVGGAAMPPYSFEYGHSQPTEVVSQSGCRVHGAAPCGSCGYCQRDGKCKAELQYSHWGYPEYFHERPFGSIVRAQLEQQVVNGIAAQSALYLYDFYPPSDGRAELLTPRGAWQLRKIAQHILTHSVQVMVESTGDAELDEARRQTVFDRLAAMAVPVPQEQIITGIPRPSGMNGLEALLVFQNQLVDTASGGAYTGGSGGTGGGNQSLIGVPLSGASQ